jgi:nitroreductase
MHTDQWIKQVFIDGRTHRIFTDKPIEENVLHQLYELAKIAPSASNLCPMRISFVVSETEKQKVIDAAAGGNKPKIASAPVVAIIAYDKKFHAHTEHLAPHMDADAFRGQEQEKLEAQAFENSWLQAGFLIAAARSLGLDCGPMSGFDKAKIDESFYQESSWRSIFLMNLGYGDTSKLHPRGNRLTFDEACSIL